jgi:hypothetical protein
MKNFEEFLKELNSKFVYKTDKLKHDYPEVWEYLDLNQEKVFGDCEDYSLTIQREFGGTIYFCKLSGWGHAVLKLPNGKWIDNVYKQPVDKLDARYTSFRKMYWFEVSIKLFIGRVLRLLK